MYTRSDIEVVCGSNQVCAGLKTGIEGLCVLYMSDLLSQVHTGSRLACAWFLKIDPVRIVSMHVCVRVYPCLRPLIASGMMWHDMYLIRLVKQVLQLVYGNCRHYH